LRNPNGIAWEPDSGALWTSVNERAESVSRMIHYNEQLEKCKMKKYLALGLALGVMAGCGNKDEPKTRCSRAARGAAGCPARHCDTAAGVTERGR